MALLLKTLLVILATSSSTAQQAGVCENRPEPAALINGKFVKINEENFSKYYGAFPPGRAHEQVTGPHDNAYFVLNKEKPVLYVSDFLNDTTISELKEFCISSQRFTRSPVRGHGNDPSVAQSDIRTSESCTLVPASIYLSSAKYRDMISQDPMPPEVANIAREVDLSWDIAVRAAGLLRVEPNLVEALQLVRYTTPDAQYRLHHDHGGFYGKQTEHRPWTMLIFLNDVSDENGGKTAFPKLGLEVIPRGGDAIIWSNTKITGEVDPDMVHMGKPPSKEGVEKYAMNVWFGGESFLTRSKEWAQW